MSEISAKCGHVTRRLNRNEPLSGKVLEFALSVLGETSLGGDKKMLSEIAKKLSSGEQLNDYECHIMIDVVLMHIPANLNTYSG